MYLISFHDEYGSEHMERLNPAGDVLAQAYDYIFRHKLRLQDILTLGCVLKAMNTAREDPGMPAELGSGWGGPQIHYIRE